MKSKAKQVENNNDLSKLKYKELIKYLDSLGDSYKMVSMPHFDSSITVIISEDRFFEVPEVPVINYFCSHCGEQIKPDLYHWKLLINKLLSSPYGWKQI